MNGLPDLRRTAVADNLTIEVLESSFRILAMGGVVKETSGKKSVVLSAGDQINELWILRSGKSKTWRFLIVGKRKDGKPELDPGYEDSLGDGEIILYPLDGKDTYAMAKELRAKARKLDFDMKPNHWPACWPENGR